RNSWCGGSDQPSWADFNGDGQADIFCDNAAGQHWVLVVDNGRLLSPNTDPGGLIRQDWCRSGEISHSDFNGDGLTDLVCDDSKSGNHWILLSTGKGIVSPNTMPDGLIRQNWCREGKTSHMDFDGDGRADLGCDNEKTGSHWVLLSRGNEVVSPNEDP